MCFFLYFASALRADSALYVLDGLLFQSYPRVIACTQHFCYLLRLSSIRGLIYLNTRIVFLSSSKPLARVRTLLNDQSPAREATLFV